MAATSLRTLPIKFMVLTMIIISQMLECTRSAVVTRKPNPTCEPMNPQNSTLTEAEKLTFQVAMNFEFLEGEFFLGGAGMSVDMVAPGLAMGGPRPVGVQRANLGPIVQNIITEFGYQEVATLRLLNTTVGGIQRPLLNLSIETYAEVVDRAFGKRLSPRFNPYRNELHYMLASSIIPYVGLVGSVGASQNLNSNLSKRLLAGLLGVEAGQDAVIRTYLYLRGKEVVLPYDFTVTEFTIRISELRNKLSGCGIKDEGLSVPLELGADRRTTSNILSADAGSLSYSRSVPELFRILHLTGNESVPGGFFPKGANGVIARQLLSS